MPSGDAARGREVLARARTYDVAAALVSLVEGLGAALALTYGGSTALLVVLAVTALPYLAVLLWLGGARRRARLEQRERDRAFLRTWMLEVIAAGEERDPERTAA